VEPYNTTPLDGVLPAKLRRALYAILFVASLVFAAFQAADGDWLLMVASLFPSLLGLMAAGNTPTE
jgi:hypothetical protein